MIEKYNKKYRSKEVMFNCEMIPAENVGVKHAKWDKRDGYNTVCNDCGHIDKRNLKACPKCNGRNLDYLTRIIGYMKRVSNFSQARQQEAARRHYATPGQL